MNNVGSTTSSILSSSTLQEVACCVGNAQVPAQPDPNPTATV